MHVLVSNFNSNPNIGLYGIVTDKAILLGKEVPTQHDTELSEVFKLPVERISIAGTSMPGVFCLWHNNTLFIPQITFDHEKEALTALGIAYKIIETELTCLGNNILASSTGALLNPEFTAAEVQTLQEALEVPCKQTTLVDTEALGSVGVIIGDKGLFHRDIPPEKVRELEHFLGIKISLGTVNMGSPYIKSGLLVSTEGFIIGDASGGPEIVNADEALGFLHKEQ